MPDEGINQKTRNPVITNKNYTFKQLTNKPYFRLQMAYLMLYPLRNINLLHINKEINMKNLQTMKQSVQKGFTLIELMIVVAIIGILAALAIPAYTDYTIKSRVGEGASLSGAFRTAIDVYWSENGTLAGNAGAVTMTELGLIDKDGNALVPEGEYVSTIIINTAVDALNPFLEVTYKTSTALGEASGDCLNYFPNKPVTDGGNLYWTPRSLGDYTTKGGKFVDVAVCTDAANQEGIPAKYRPRS